MTHIFIFYFILFFHLLRKNFVLRYLEYKNVQLIIMRHDPIRVSFTFEHFIIYSPNWKLYRSTFKRLMKFMFGATTLPNLL